MIPVRIRTRIQQKPRIRVRIKTSALRLPYLPKDKIQTVHSWLIYLYTIFLTFWPQKCVLTRFCSIFSPLHFDKKLTKKLRRFTWETYYLGPYKFIRKKDARIYLE
jgi:hypothetical protein